MTAFAVADRALGTLDHLRRWWFALCLRQPTLARVLVRRDSRTAAVATLSVAAALALAMVAPLVPLLLGPVVLGVAHVASDVRHLVLRRQLSRACRWLVGAGVAALFALRALSELGLWRSSGRVEWVVVLTWMGTGLALAVRESGVPVRRARWCALALVVVGAAAIIRPDEARWVFLHAHNLVALAIWATLFRRKNRGPRLPLPLALALALAGSALLASGVFTNRVLAGPGAQLFGLHLLQACDWIAPGLSVRWAVGLTMAFAFLQSVHYLTWLFLIPQDEQTGQGTLTFRMSAQSLHRDFGAWALVVVIGLALLVGAAAAVSLLRTRAVYLSLAMFHGYLELSLWIYLGVRAAGLNGPRVAAR